MVFVLQQCKGQASGTTPPAIAPANQPSEVEDGVTLNWAFFSPPQFYPSTFTDLTKRQFERQSGRIRTTFAATAAEASNQQVKSTKIQFWKPIKYVSIEDSSTKEWLKNLSSFHEHFTLIPEPLPFAKFFGDETSDSLRLHLIITAHEVLDHMIVPIHMVGNHEETRDSVGELQPQRLLKSILADKGPSPSEGSKFRTYAATQSKSTQTIFDERYTVNGHCTIAPPVEIFHPGFDGFRHRFRIATPSRDDLIKVQQFMKTANQIHPGNLYHAAALQAELSAILGVPLTMESNRTISSGTVGSFDLGRIKLAAFLIEVKGEWGECGSDAYTQAGLSMKSVWADNRPGTVEIRSKCCCPTFILVGGGPWLGVLGGVFTERVIVQRLTDMMWIEQSSTFEDSRVYRFSQMMVALRESLLELREYYAKLITDDSLACKPNVPHPRFFPYPTSCAAVGRIVRWSYLRALESDSTCVTYLAEMKESSKLIVVKFVDRYGQDVHRYLANQGHAPRLWYCGPLEPSRPTTFPLPTKSSLPGIVLGSLLMVVMDYVEPWPPAMVKLHASMKHQLKNILSKMHKSGYAFGHLREPNVILDQCGEVKLIGFDWAGRYDVTVEDELLDTDAPGVIPDDVLRAIKSRQNLVGNASFATYPVDLSKSTFANTGADNLIPIRPVHDWRMLGMLKLPDERTHL